ncbi:MAG: M28 family metallopeptidase [Acidobacteriaceae bacterium]
MCAQQGGTWTVKSEWVRAHEEFLASDILQGRGSATRDEGIAATYVGSQFHGYGLQLAPGAKSYVDTVAVEKPELDGKALISFSGISLQEGGEFSIPFSSGASVSGPLQKIHYADQQGAVKIEPGAIVLLLGAESAGERAFASASKLGRQGAKAVFLAETPGLQEIFQDRFGGKTRTTVHLKDSTDAPLGGTMSLVLLKPEAMTQVSGLKDGEQISLALNALPSPPMFTYNAMGWLPGSDPNAGTILLTAHLDHLGLGKPVNGDSIYNGADDDAAGTTAVLELAHALALGPKLKRNILFVCFGSEELGGKGADYFREHPPIPLAEIVANLEFEMIGAQDPKMPKGTLLLTGWDRSDLGPTLASHGAKLGADPYPEQHFFERSDNYALALKGVVAHTAGGWGTPPYYHQPSDDLQHLDFDFMTSAIQSLIEPVRWIANSDFKPRWNPGGQPKQ